MSQVPLLKEKEKLDISSIRCCTAQVDDVKKLATSADATVLMVDADQLFEAESRGKADPRSHRKADIYCN